MHVRPLTAQDQQRYVEFLLISKLDRGLFKSTDYVVSQRQTIINEKGDLEKATLLSPLFGAFAQAGTLLALGQYTPACALPKREPCQTKYAILSRRTGAATLVAEQWDFILPYFTSPLVKEKEYSPALEALIDSLRDDLGRPAQKASLTLKAPLSSPSFDPEIPSEGFTVPQNEKDVETLIHLDGGAHPLYKALTKHHGYRREALVAQYENFTLTLTQ